jgi:hypothetical protein
VGAPKGHPPYSGCEKGGRKRVYTDERIEEEGRALEEWMKNPDNFWVYSFAESRGYSKQNLARWAKRNKKFRRLYRRARDAQMNRIMVGAVHKRYDTKAVQMILANWYKISPQPKVQLMSSGTLEAILELVREKEAAKK